MVDRGKVIKGLAHCTRPSEVGKGGNFCMDCPYTEPIGFNQFKYNSQQMMKDALAILKEHRHGETFTVIDTKTGKEADEYEIALHEDWAKDLCYCDMDGWAIMDDGSLLLVDECGRCAYADRERFKVKWE